MSTQFVAALVMLLNAARADAQLPPFREDPALSGRARQRAEWMCSTRQFTHDGYQAAFAGLRYTWKGETLAMARIR